MNRIGIVGAGPAGLAAAYALRDASAITTVFEKSRGFGGRAATRGYQQHRYDHGANYFRLHTDRVRQLVIDDLPTDSLVRVKGDVREFDRDGHLRPLEATDDDDPRWTYRSGISTLGKLLARQASTEVRTRTRIEQIRSTGTAWLLRSSQGDIGRWDALILTPPAPQTADLFEKRLDKPSLRKIQEAIAGIEYTSQFSYILAYDRSLSPPDQTYGLLNSEGTHPIAWIGFEHKKPGHVPENRRLFVVQTAPHWTAPRVNDEPGAFLSDITEQAGVVLNENLSDPTWFDTQRWRFALPRSGLDEDIVSAAADDCLFLAGDYVAGTGRVDVAIETGLNAAHRVQSQLLDS